MIAFVPENNKNPGSQNNEEYTIIKDNMIVGIFDNLDAAELFMYKNKLTGASIIFPNKERKIGAKEASVIQKVTNKKQFI